MRTRAVLAVAPSLGKLRLMRAPWAVMCEARGGLAHNGLIAGTRRHKQTGEAG